MTTTTVEDGCPLVKINRQSSLKTDCLVQSDVDQGLARRITACAHCLAFSRYFPSFVVALGEYIESSITKSPFTGSAIGDMDFGDNSTVSPPARVTTLGLDIITAVINVQHTYSKQSGPRSYIAKLSGLNRITEVINSVNSDLVYILSTNVTIQAPTSAVPLNSAPVSNIFPVVYVKSGEANTFRVHGIDAQTNVLLYTLATTAIMSQQGVNQTQPQGLGITIDGVLSFTPTQVGYYYSQVVISDRVNWIVTDFLLRSVVATMKEPYFLSPTPKDNDVIRCHPNSTCTWSYVGKTDLDGKSVVINSLFVPLGIVKETLENGTLVNTWTPTMQQIGSYVITLNIQDTSVPPLFMFGTRSFTIIVHVATESYLLDAFHQIHHIVVSVTLVGANPLIAMNAYPDIGDQSVNQIPSVQMAASPTLASLAMDHKSGIISSITSPQSFTTPSAVQVYLVPGGDSVNVSLSTFIPNPLPLVDIYLLIEVGTGSPTSAINYKSYIEYFIKKFQGYGEGVSFGFVEEVKIAVEQPIAQSFNPFKLFDTIYMAATSSLGWRSGSYHNLILLSVHDCENSTTSSMPLKAYDALRRKSVSINVVSVESQPFPNFSSIQQNYYYFGRFSEVSNFRTGEISGRWADKAYTPTPPTQTSMLSITIAGFGEILINAQYNHPPVPRSTPIWFYEDVPHRFSLISFVSDSDSNILTIEFPSLSLSNGVISLFDGSPCAPNTPYLSTQEYMFTPNGNIFGGSLLSYIVDDGCLTANGTLNIIVQARDDAPVCSPVPVSTNINTPAIFSLVGSDSEDSTNLTVVLDSLDLVGKFGPFTILPSDAPAQINKAYPITTQFKFIQKVNPTSIAKATFTYRVNDTQ
eukprot:gene9768-11406_t